MSAAIRPLVSIPVVDFREGGLVGHAASERAMSPQPRGSTVTISASGSASAPPVISGVFVKSLLVFWLIANVVNTPKRLRRFMTVLALAGAPLVDGEALPLRIQDRIPVAGEQSRLVAVHVWHS